MKNKKLLAESALGLIAVGGISGWLIFADKKPTTLPTYWNEKTEINQADTSGSLPLIKAIQAKDISVVKYLLAHGADINKKDKTGITALEAAAATGDMSIFASVAEVNKNSLTLPTIMSKAIEGGNKEIVNYLLDNGSNVNGVIEIKGKQLPGELPNYTDPRVITPLKKAVTLEQISIITLLLNRGAEGGEFLLKENIRSGKPEVIEALGNSIKDLTFTTIDDKDLLEYASRVAPKETLSYLINRNAGNINNAFQEVLRERKDGKIIQDNISYTVTDTEEIIKLFLNKGARVTAEDMQLMLQNNRSQDYLTLAQCSYNPNGITNEDKTLLSISIEKGYTEGVKYILSYDVDLWLPEQDGTTPISNAVQKARQYPEIFELIKNKLGNINAQGYKGETLLMLLASIGDATNFRKILEEGGDIYQVDNMGQNMLMYAAQGGNEEILRTNLGKGININAKDKRGKTALMYAFEHGHISIAKYLIERGAQIEDVDYEGRNTLMYATENITPEIITLYIYKNGSYNATDNNGRTLLMYAALNKNIPLLKELIKRTDNINQKDYDGKTALAYAAEGGDTEVIRILLKAGADIYRADKQNKIPAFYAAQQGNQEAFKLLTDFFTTFTTQQEDTGKAISFYVAENNNLDMQQKVFRSINRENANQTDSHGRTALMYLVSTGRTDTVRSFISKGADITARDNFGKSVLMYAAEGEVGVNMVTVLQRLKNNQINLKDADGKTALMYALSGKDSKIAKIHLLLERDIIDTEATDNTGKSVLMYAVGNQKSEIEELMLKELLEKINQIDKTDNNGKTALMYAAENPQASIKILDMLIDKGANINAVDNNGKSVLMYAVQSGDISKFLLLKSKGTSISSKTTDGKTILDFAKQNGPCFTKAIEELLNK